MDFRSDFEFVKSYINHNFKNFSLGSGTQQVPSNVYLLVKSGFLAGTERLIEDSNIFIGSDDSADIILLDEGVEPLHVQMSFERDVLGLKTTIRCLAAPVRVPIYGDLKINETRTVRGSTNITIGSVIIVVEDRKKSAIKISKSSSKNALQENSSADKPQSSIALKDLKSLSVFKSSSLLLGSGALLLSIIGLTFMIIANMMSGANNPSFSGIPLVEEKTSPEGLAQQITTTLKDQGLLGPLSVAITQEGGVEVSGQVSKAQHSQWLDIMQWYDQKSGLPTIINLAEEKTTQDDLPNIKYVWFDIANPYVVLANGKRISTGQIVENGWKLKNITSDSVTLSLASRHVKINF